MPIISKVIVVLTMQFLHCFILCMPRSYHQTAAFAANDNIGHLLEIDMGKYGYGCFLSSASKTEFIFYLQNKLYVHCLREMYVDQPNISTICIAMLEFSIDMILLK